MEKSPLFSIIITNHNGKKWLKNCFTSVLTSNYPKLEIIFVDNASTDGSVEFIKKNFPKKQIHVIENKKDLGWSGANNKGALKAKGKYLVFLSNDMEVKKDWLKRLLEVFKISSDVGVVQCFSLSMKDKKMIDSPRNYLDRFGFLYSYQPGKQPKEVSIAEGMAFAVKRELIEKGILLDEYFVMEYDDADYSWRARLAGYKVYFTPQTIVYHARGGTVGRTYFSRDVANLRQYTRNHLVSLIKNYQLKNLLITFPVAFFLHLGKAFFLLLMGKLRLCFAVLGGLSQVFLHLPLILRKRKEVQSQRKVSDKEIMKRMVVFRPSFMISYITLQAKGKKPIIYEEPKFIKPLPFLLVKKPKMITSVTKRVTIGS